MQFSTTNIKEKETQMQTEQAVWAEQAIYSDYPKLVFGLVCTVMVKLLQKMFQQFYKVMSCTALL